MIESADRVPLVNGTLSGLSQFCTQVTFSQGDLIFGSGDPAACVYVLLDGRVATGAPAITRSFDLDVMSESGRIIGWEPLVFRDSTRLNEARAETDVTLLAINLPKNPEILDSLGAEARLSLRNLSHASQAALERFKRSFESAIGHAGGETDPIDNLVNLLIPSFFNTDMSQIGRWIRKAVGTLGAFLGAEQVMLYRMDLDRDILVHEESWTPAGPQQGAAGRTFGRDEAPWIWKRLDALEAVIIESANDLPSEAKADRVWLSERASRVSLLIPLHDNDKIVGLLDLQLRFKSKNASHTMRRIAETLAKIMAAALGRLETEDRLRKLAHFDGLTGLTNKLLFEDRVSRALARARRAGGKAALLFLNLDQFARLNESIGWAECDQLLRNVADRLNQCARETDTIGRIGGDEFAVLMEDIEGNEDAMHAVHRIIAACNQPIHLESRSHYVGVSIGIAIYPEHGAEAHLLLRAAADAMRTAKEVTGSSYVFYSPDNSLRPNMRIQVEVELRTAIAERQVVAYYQPIVDVRNSRIYGAEALLRWSREDGTVLGPSYFLPIAEATGIIVPLSRQLLRQVCEETVRWNRRFRTELTTAVNVSTRWLVDPDFLDFVDRTLKETGLPPHCLTLELTEEILTRDLEASARALTGLKTIGVKLALDDFGTGYSSLMILERFTIDSIKIDRSFVSSIGSLDNDAPILRGALAMSRELGVSSIAEGVETETQAGYLRRHGGRLCQGYYFGKPMSAEAFESRLQQQFETGVSEKPVESTDQSA